MVRQRSALGAKADIGLHENLAIFSLVRLPEEDDFVEVLKGAPKEFSPGRRGVVVSVAKCLSKVTEKATSVPVGDHVIWVGIIDSGTAEAKVIPAQWLSVIDQNE